MTKQEKTKATKKAKSIYNHYLLFVKNNELAFTCSSIAINELIINSENGKKKGEAINNIILNIDGTQLIFRADNSSKMADKTMVFIVNGLNHLLFWAQDKEKEIFINKFFSLFNWNT